MEATAPDPTDELARLIRRCLAASSPLNMFNEIVLERGRYWRAQREIARALWNPSVHTVAVPAGHSVGKSYFAAGAIVGWLTLMPQSLVVSTSPSNVQLSHVLWKEIRRARAGSALLRDLGRITRQPNKLDYGLGWEAIGYATNKAERIQGFHAAGGQFLVVVDEASGVLDPDIWATLASLKPDKVLLISNPLRAYGHFYETCKRAEDDPSVELIRIPSTASPDIDLEVSPRGLADAKFLREMAAQYGVGSQTWQVRVEAQFPDGSADVLIPSAWLDLAGRAIHTPGGHRRIAVDLALGNGGDQTVILVRDDNGILHWEASNRLPFGPAARRVRELAGRFGVAPNRITWDAEGLGADFGYRLQVEGLVGCMPYRGSLKSADKRYENLRGACFFGLRHRLDPDRPARTPAGVLIPRAPFAIPADFLPRLRRELRELTHQPGKEIATSLRPKEDIKAALRHSPDFSDALAQSFAYPNS